MSQEHDDYADPEPPGRAQLRFDLSVIGWAVVLMVLVFSPAMLLAVVIHVGLRG